MGDPRSSRMRMQGGSATHDRLVHDRALENRARTQEVLERARRRQAADTPQPSSGESGGAAPLVIFTEPGTQFAPPQPSGPPRVLPAPPPFSEEFLRAARAQQEVRGLRPRTRTVTVGAPPRTQSADAARARERETPVEVAPPIPERVPEAPVGPAAPPAALPQTNPQSLDSLRQRLAEQSAQLENLRQSVRGTGNRLGAPPHPPSPDGGTMLRNNPNRTRELVREQQIKRNQNRILQEEQTRELLEYQNRAMRRYQNRHASSEFLRVLELLTPAERKIANRYLYNDELLANSHSERERGDLRNRLNRLVRVGFTPRIEEVITWWEIDEYGFQEASRRVKERADSIHIAQVHGSLEINWAAHNREMLEATDTATSGLLASVGAGAGALIQEAQGGQYDPNDHTAQHVAQLGANLDEFGMAVVPMAAGHIERVRYRPESESRQVDPIHTTFGPNIQNLSAEQLEQVRRPRPQSQPGAESRPAGPRYEREYASEIELTLPPEVREQPRGTLDRSGAETVLEAALSEPVALGPRGTENTSIVPYLSAGGRNAFLKEILETGLTNTQINNLARLLNHRLSSSQMSAFNRLWRQARAPYANEIREIQNMFAEGASPRDIAEAARAVFGNIRKDFNVLVNSNPETNATLESAGIQTYDNGNSPTIHMNTLRGVREVTIDIDHLNELGQFPMQSFSFGNLRFTLARENRIVLNQIMARDPFQPAVRMRRGSRAYQVRFGLPNYNDGGGYR